MTADEIARDIVDAALKVHGALGSGLLESAYQACPAHELHRRFFFSWRAWRSWRFVLPEAGEEAFKKFALMGAPRGYDVSALSG